MRARLIQIKGRGFILPYYRLTHTNSTRLTGKDRICSVTSASRPPRAPAAPSFGVCGKDPRPRPPCRTCWSTRPRASRCTPTARPQLGARDREVDVFVIEALFTTVTNVNFDPERLAGASARAPPRCATRRKTLYEDACAQGRQDARRRSPARPPGSPPPTSTGLVAQGARRRASPSGRRSFGDDVDRPAGADPLRPEGRGRLRRPRPGPRQGRRRRSTPPSTTASTSSPSRTRRSTTCSAGR